MRRAIGGRIVAADGSLRILKPERGAGEVQPVVLEVGRGGHLADIRTRAGPGLDEALGRQDLQGVLGRGLTDAIPGDDAVPGRRPGAGREDTTVDLLPQVFEHTQINRIRRGSHGSDPPDVPPRWRSRVQQGASRHCRGTVRQAVSQWTCCDHSFARCDSAVTVGDRWVWCFITRLRHVTARGYFFRAKVRPSPMESIASSTRVSVPTYSLKSLIARASGSGSGSKIRPCRKVLSTRMIPPLRA